jgi:hypothetical protein
MTKEQFLNGTVFRVAGPTYKGAETYSYNLKDNYMSKQVRSSIDERIVLDDYVCNVLKVGRTCFTGFTHVMRKKVVVSYKFKDLIEFKIEEELI